MSVWIISIVLSLFGKRYHSTNLTCCQIRYNQPISGLARLPRHGYQVSGYFRLFVVSGFKSNHVIKLITLIRRHVWGSQSGVGFEMYLCVCRANVQRHHFVADLLKLLNFLCIFFIPLRKLKIRKVARSHYLRDRITWDFLPHSTEASTGMLWG